MLMETSEIQKKNRSEYFLSFMQISGKQRELL